MHDMPGFFFGTCLAGRISTGASTASQKESPHAAGSQAQLGKLGHAARAACPLRIHFSFTSL